jgi:hypothetical protein
MTFQKGKPFIDFEISAVGLRNPENAPVPGAATIALCAAYKFFWSVLPSTPAISNSHPRATSKELLLFETSRWQNSLARVCNQ